MQHGPYAAFVSDSKITIESSEGSYNFENNSDEDDKSNFEFGVGTGIGLDFYSFRIGARYNCSLNTMGKETTVLGQT